MLRITIKGDELFDEETSTFSTVGDFDIDLEHSLLSVSKWESKYQKPFLTPDSKSQEELLYYIQAMIITPNYPIDTFIRLSNENLNEINNYIESSQSATTFGQMPEARGRGETITSELIYYWMVSFNIPFICEQWHLNRLLALIRICNIKSSPPKKMSKSEIAARNRELNARRRAELGTSG